MATSLRPLSVGEILDAGIKVVTRHWKPLVGTIAILTGPVFVVYVLLIASIDKELLGLSASFSTSTTTSSTGAEDVDATEVVGFVLAYVLLTLTFLIAFVACFKAVSDAWLGSAPSLKRSLRFAWRRLLKVGVLAVVWVIAVTIGYVLCVLPGVWLSVAWCVSLPVLLFEDAGPFESLKRSASLIKQRWWATFLLCVVGYLLVSIIGGLIQLALEGIAEAVSDATVVLAIAQVISMTASSAITYPYLAAVLTILYFDQRVRKEGFDLQLQAEGFGAGRDPDAPLPAPLIGDDRYTPEQRAAAPYWPPPPGWTPPPAEPSPAQWASSSGWSAPSAGDPLHRDEDPADPLPPREPAGDEPPPTYPGWQTPKSQAGEKRDDEDDDDDKPDRNRASWLPPEPPRGPGGL